VRTNCPDFLSVLRNSEIPSAVSCPASAAFNDTVIGYIMTFEKAATLLVTTEPRPYPVPTAIAERYFLSAGDKVTAAVSAESDGNCFVTDIIRVNRQTKIPSNYTKHFDDMEGVSSADSVTVNRQAIRLGSTTMVTVKQNESISDKIGAFIAQCGAVKSIKIALGIQEKRENLNRMLANGCDYGYMTEVSQPLKQQLMIMLTAFFRAKELAEQGHRVFLFINSFEKLLFLLNSAIVAQNDLPDSCAMYNAERDMAKVIRSSKALADGGSLSIVGSFTANGGAGTADFRRRIETMCDFVI
jgi:transcription termination factor Rho